MSNNIKVNLGSAFKGLLTKLENKSPLMAQISVIMFAEVRENFNSEGRPKWSALSDKTIEDRRRKGYWPGKILHRRGGNVGLLGTITVKSDENSSQVGTNRKYAAIHQFGGIITKNAQSSLYGANRYSQNSAKHRKGQFKKGRRTEFGQGFTFKAHSINIPARPFLKISDDGMKNIEKAVVDYLKK